MKRNNGFSQKTLQFWLKPNTNLNFINGLKPIPIDEFIIHKSLRAKRSNLYLKYLVLYLDTSVTLAPAWGIRMENYNKEMNTISQFINRNKDTYKKQSNVSMELIEKYDKMFKGYFPKEILWIWENMGFGIYEDGFLQLVNPEEYNFVFEYIDKRLEPTIVIGLTALGDILIWEGNDNWTIAPDEGNRLSLINIRKLRKEILGSKIKVHLNIIVADEEDIADPEMYDSKEYLNVKNTLPKLQYGQCYGYVPALALGGKAKNENLQIVDAKTYINIIGEAVGKIYEF